MVVILHNSSVVTNLDSGIKSHLLSAVHAILLHSHAFFFNSDLWLRINIAHIMSGATTANRSDIITPGLRGCCLKNPLFGLGE